MRGTGCNDVPQAASLSGYPVTRRFLSVVGEVLLSISALGIIAGLVWLTESKLNGTLLQIFDQPGEVMLYAFPALLFLIAIVGLALVGRSLAPTTKKHRHLHHHAHFHA